MDRNILRDMQDILAAMPGTDSMRDDDSDLISALMSDSNIQMSRVDSVLQRLDGTIALVSKGNIQ